MLSDIAFFVWDAGNYAKCQKHGVSIEEIEYLFQASPLLVADLKHSLEEARYFAIGESCKGRHVFAAFTVIEGEAGNYIRPLSVRYMHKKEIRRYEQETTHLPKR